MTWLSYTFLGKAKFVILSGSEGPAAEERLAAAGLSLSLAMLNVLPIPALDGGHLLIILVEAAIGHELSQRFKLGFQRAGIAILLTLMVYVFYLDIKRRILG